MSARTRLIVTGVVALVVCLIFYFFFIRPRKGDLSRTRSEVTTADNLTSSLRATLQDLEQLREDAPRLNAELEEFRDLVPQRNDVANFVLQVQDAATASGVLFAQVDPDAPRIPPEAAPLAQVRVTIAAQGGYFSVQDFMRRMTELDRAVGIDVLTLQTEEDEEEIRTRGRINLQMAVRIFFELPEQQAPVSGSTTTTPPPTDTTATPPPAGAGATPAPVETATTSSETAG